MPRRRTARVLQQKVATCARTIDLESSWVRARPMPWKDISIFRVRRANNCFKLFASRRPAIGGPPANIGEFLGMCFNTSWWARKSTISINRNYEHEYVELLKLMWTVEKMNVGDARAGKLAKSVRRWSTWRTCATATLSDDDFAHLAELLRSRGQRLRSLPCGFTLPTCSSPPPRAIPRRRVQQISVAKISPLWICSGTGWSTVLVYLLPGGAKCDLTPPIIPFVHRTVIILLHGTETRC